MKQKFTSLIVALICGVTLFPMAVLAQEGQLIPFQGSLYENGKAVNATVNITFTIDNPTWTETHENVTVVQGLYSVVLGQLDSFPREMFTTGTPPQLIMNIGGTDIATVALYAPYISKEIVKMHMPDSFVKDITGKLDSTGISSYLGGAVDPSNTSFYQIANSNVANTSNGKNVGVLGHADNSSDEWQVGVAGRVAGSGTGPRYGIRGDAFGDNTAYSVGVLGYNYVMPTIGGEVFGAKFRTRHGVDSSRNYGMFAEALGAQGSNIGVYGRALNSDFENWAGWFDGDVNVNGDLILNGKSLGENNDFKIFNPNDELRGEFNYFESNDAGNLLLYGANDSLNVIVGSGGGGHSGFIGVYDSLRNQGAAMWTSNKGQGQFYARNTSHRVSGWFGNIGDNGFTQLVDYNDAGDDSDGAILTGFWAGKPELYMELGNGDHKVDLSIENNAGNFWMRGENSQNIEMGTKHWENVNGTDLPYLKLVGAVEIGDTTNGFYRPDLVWMDVSHNENDNSETGSLTLRGTDGSEFRLTSHGIQGNDQQTFFLNGEQNENISVLAESHGLGDLATGWGAGSYNIGLRGNASNNVWGNVGLTGYAEGTIGFDNAGGTFFSQVDDGSDSVNNRGIYAHASGPGVNYGVYGQALGGIENWAGWFQGDVNVTGKISATTLQSSDGAVQTSDKRFKKNVKTIDNALAKTEQLNGYTYNWNKLAKKQKGITSEEEQVGVIAQELEAVFPQLVKTDKEGYKAVNYAALTAVLIEAIKELSNEVSTLKGENLALKAEISKVDALTAKINFIEKLLVSKAEIEGEKTAAK